MNPVSATQVENTRKIGARLQGEILRRLAEVTQDRAADCMGVSPSTLSRQKEDLERFCQLLAALNIQLSPEGAITVSKEEIRSLERMAFKYLQARLESNDDSGTLP